MSEIAALNKYPCAACGAEAVWNPTLHALVCPYCGTVSPAELSEDGSAIHEHDLMTALRSIPPQMRGWDKERVPVQCQSCKAISLFESTRVAQRCDFCGSPAVVPYQETRAPIHPESLLPFKVDQSNVRDSVRAWYGSRWWAPNRLKSGALTDTVHGIYVPYWTFDAQVHADWTADAGYYYWDSETYRDSNGRTQTRQVRKVRWEPAAGSIDHFFDDELVPATRGIEEKHLRKIEPFPTAELIAYNTGYVSGWVVEQYQIDLAAAAQSSRAIMERKTEQLCSQDVPGDTQRNLQVDADFSKQTFKHILVPVWVIAYDYGSRRFQIVVNGFTGQIAGDHPLSWIKITLAVLAVLIAMAIFMALYQGQ